MTVFEALLMSVLMAGGFWGIGWLLKKKCEKANHGCTRINADERAAYAAMKNAAGQLVDTA